MELYPSDENGWKWVYNAGMALLTVLTATQVHPLLAFSVACVWALVWFFDLYVREMIWPAPPPSMTEEEKMAKAENDWFMRDRDKVMGQLQKQAEMMQTMQARFDARMAEMEKKQ